jgi:hypothetical protein
MLSEPTALILMHFILPVWLLAGSGAAPIYLRHAEVGSWLLRQQ